MTDLEAIDKRLQKVEDKLDRLLSAVDRHGLDQYCSVDTAIVATEMSRRVIEDAYLTGEIRYVKKGRSVRLLKKDVNEWMKRDLIQTKIKKVA